MHPKNDDAVKEVTRLLNAALDAAPGTTRDALRQETPRVIKSLADLAVSAPKVTVRKWAFKLFFGLLRGTVIRDTQLANAVANRKAREAEAILANVSRIKAMTEARKANNKSRAETARALRVLAAAKKIEGNDATEG